MKILTQVKLYELVRDGTTLTGAPLKLLETIAWMANPKQAYSCFPSYARLAQDTHYTEEVLRIAARKLEALGFIKRSIRLNRSNVFHLNVPLLAKLALENRSSCVKNDETADIQEPFQILTPPDKEEADPDNTDGLEAGPQPDEAEEGDEILTYPLCRNVEEVVELVREIWPEHPTFSEPRGEEFLRKDIELCVAFTETTARCGQLLNHIYHQDDAAYQAVARSKKLGPYLRKCFPTWMREYGDTLTPVGEEIEVT